MPQPIFLPKEDFLKTFTQVPRLAISLLLVHKKKGVLLTKRANEPLVDHWHLPGSFLLKNEAMKECVSRIGYDELNLDLALFPVRFVGVYENLSADPRGHVVDLVYRYQVDKELNLSPHKDTKEMSFFSTLPGPMGFDHQKIILDQIPSLTHLTS